MNEVEIIFKEKIEAYFSQVKNDLLAIVGKNNLLYHELKEYCVNVIDNTELDGYYYHCIEKADKNKLSYNFLKEFTGETVGTFIRSTNPILGELSMLRIFKNIISRHILGRMSYKDICHIFFENILEYSQNVKYEETDELFIITYDEIDFSLGYLKFFNSKTNIMIIPKEKMDDVTEFKQIDNNGLEITYIITEFVSKEIKAESKVKIIDKRDLIFHISSEFHKLTALISNKLRFKKSKVFKLIDFLKFEQSTEFYNLEKKLENIEESNGRILEEFCEIFLELVLKNEYKDVEIKTQVRSIESVTIKDFIITNRYPKNRFFKFLKEGKNVNYLLFDAKNYKGELTPHDLDTFINYIRGNKEYGNFGIILSQNGISKNCDTKLKFAYASDKIEILCLDREDMGQMINKVSSGRSAVEIIENKHDDFVLSLP